MFDVGFWELCLIALVSLLVIGPEKLPKVARISGFWIGKTRHMVATVKQEISDELQAEEIKQMLKEQAAVEELNEIKQHVTNSMRQIDSLPETENPAQQPKQADLDDRS